MIQFLTRAVSTVDGVMRLVTFALILICVLQMIFMLAHYWHRVIPLRRRVLDQTRESGVFVVAPPVWITFVYHFIITLIFVIAGAGVLQLLARGSDPTAFTYASPWLFGVMAVVVNRFSSYYSDTLNEAQWRVLRDEVPTVDRLHRERSTCPDPPSSTEDVREEDN